MKFNIKLKFDNTIYITIPQSITILWVLYEMLLQMYNHHLPVYIIYPF